MKQSSRKSEEDSLLAFVASRMICESHGVRRGWRVEGRGSTVRAPERLELPKLARISDGEGGGMKIAGLGRNASRVGSFGARYIFVANALYKCVIWYYRYANVYLD